jgi:hypothetical protein
MDAVTVAPESSEFATNPSVGRFDARASLLPNNDWAADLFDYVTARQMAGPKLNFPDVPATLVDATPANNSNDPTVPLTDQDGPVHGEEAAANASVGVPWVRWQSEGGGGFTSSRREPALESGNASGSSQLIAGTININTAPDVVLRMLPWVVDPATGYLDQSPGTTWNAYMRHRVGIISDRLANPAAQPAINAGLTRGSPAFSTPYGFTSTMALADLPQLRFDDPQITAADTAARANPVETQQLMRYGMLNPYYRPEGAQNDFNLANINMTRVSNLTSQRSDAYTVYVTVQAWTYVAEGPGTGAPNDKQFTGTRLVGERRGSFIVDRSRISQERFKPADLIVHPIEQE